MTRIAIVNNDPDFLSLMDDLLDDEGYDSLVVHEAQHAYETLKSEGPDLIILDIRINEPEDGWNIAQLLTLDPETHHIPVIVCSADLPSLRAREQWLREHEIGALPKPFDLDDLLASVRTALTTGVPPVALPAAE